MHTNKSIVSFSSSTKESYISSCEFTFISIRNFSTLLPFMTRRIYIVNRVVITISIYVMQKFKIIYLSFLPDLLSISFKPLFRLFIIFIKE